MTLQQLLDPLDLADGVPQAWTCTKLYRRKKTAKEMNNAENKPKIKLHQLSHKILSEIIKSKENVLQDCVFRKTSAPYLYSSLVSLQAPRL